MYTLSPLTVIQVTKAENLSLKSDAEEQAGMIRRWNEKAKKLTELEKHLNKKQMELATERRLVTELKRKLDRDFVSKRNLQVNDCHHTTYT